MTLRLEQCLTPVAPLEADALRPDKLATLRPAEIEKLPLHYGNEQGAVADFFNVSGSAADGNLRITGQLGKVKLLGAGMTGGRLDIEGDVGQHTGAGMTGGEITINGNAGDWAGAEMAGGRIIIRGDAGHMAGSAYRGGAVGMTGGELIIHGRAGNEAGNAMRNGLLAIAGNSGDFTGVNMLAGTIIVLGGLGIRSGAGMRRGSIISLQGAELLPSFRYACRLRPAWLRLYLVHLRSCGLRLADEHLDGVYARYSGDGVALNKGEILLYVE